MQADTGLGLLWNSFPVLIIAMYIVNLQDFFIATRFYDASRRLQLNKASYSFAKGIGGFKENISSYITDQQPDLVINCVLSLPKRILLY